MSPRARASDVAHRVATEGSEPGGNMSKLFTSRSRRFAAAGWVGLVVSLVAAFGPGRAGAAPHAGTGGRPHFLRPRGSKPRQPQRQLTYHGGKVQKINVNYLIFRA